MQNILFTAIGVGGATAIGVLIGYLFKRRLMLYSAYITSLAAGIMLAAVGGLIEPAISGGTLFEALSLVFGIAAGVSVLYLIERFIPKEMKEDTGSSALLFAIAIAIHNLPEGIAAGVAFGAGDGEGAFGIIFGIALHNLPEGMIAITPLISQGVKPYRAIILAMAGAVAEVVGSFIGYYAVILSEAILPFSLSFAGGTMLAVIIGEMIPDLQREKSRITTITLVIGYAMTVLLSALLK